MTKPFALVLLMSILTPIAVAHEHQKGHFVAKDEPRAVDGITRPARLELPGVARSAPMIMSSKPSPLTSPAALTEICLLSASPRFPYIRARIFSLRG